MTGREAAIKVSRMDLAMFTLHCEHGIRAIPVS